MEASKVAASKRTTKFARQATVFLLLAIGASTVVQAANIYRYKDESGRVVISSIMPPNMVKFGYEVLNERGQVIQTVPRASTEAEIAAQQAARQALLDEEEALKRQREADNLLIRQYRSPDEVARKRDERVRQIDAQMTVIVASRNKLRDEITAQEQVVANARSRDLEPAETVLATIATKTTELDRLALQLEGMEQEKVAVAANAEGDIRRLRELLNLPEQPAAE
jgi:hypothetical protein